MRIDTQHLFSPRPRHAIRVIAIAAANIEHAAIGKGADRRFQTRPLKVAAPLRINPHAKQLKRTLAPRNKRLEMRAKFKRRQAAVEVPLITYNEPRRVQLNPRWLHSGQGVERLCPPADVAMIKRAGCHRRERFCECDKAFAVGARAKALTLRCVETR